MLAHKYLKKSNTKKLLILDLDGVLFQKPWYESGDEKVAVSTWDILFQELGPTMYNMHEQLKENFKKEIFKNYLEWTANACGVLKSYGLTKDVQQLKNSLINNLLKNYRIKIATPTTPASIIIFFCDNIEVLWVVFVT